MADPGDGLPESLLELSGLLLSDETLDSSLQRVVDLALRAIPGCDAAGVTLVREETPSTAVATNALTLELDSIQYRTGEGPCLQAIRDETIYRIDDMRNEVRFGQFPPQAVEAGVLSSLSLPLAVRDEVLGALNLYAQEIEGFDAAEDSARLFAGQAAVALANTQVHRSAVRLAEQLRDALESRPAIEQAKGMIMAERGVTADQAFDILRKASQDANVKLRDLAQQWVDDAVTAAQSRSSREAGAPAGDQGLPTS